MKIAISLFLIIILAGCGGSDGTEDSKSENYPAFPELTLFFEYPEGDSNSFGLNLNDTIPEHEYGATHISGSGAVYRVSLQFLSSEKNIDRYRLNLTLNGEEASEGIYFKGYDLILHEDEELRVVLSAQNKIQRTRKESGNGNSEF